NKKPEKGQSGQTVEHLKREKIFGKNLVLDRVTEPGEEQEISGPNFAVSVKSENVRVEIGKNNFQQVILIMGKKNPSKEFFLDSAKQIGDPYKIGTVFKHKDGKIHYAVRVDRVDTLRKKIPNLFGDKILNLLLFDRVDLRIKVTRSK
ncbi:hypothetical protein ACFL35_09240, partial [Candidatus Riflebacteria bacterium]